MVMVGSEDKLMGCAADGRHGQRLQARSPAAGRGKEVRRCCCAE
jgi:hypothetical protein